MAEPIDATTARTVLENADLLYTSEQVKAAVTRMASAISSELQDQDPLVIVVMNGALIPASLLFLEMNFPFQTSYVHVTRYRGATAGGALKWVARPDAPVAGRTVLVIDDIFDEGHTLKAIIDDMRDSGARRVYSAALVNKLHDRKEDLKVDFVGLDIEDRYVFGCGMDYQEYWRNLPAIYAINGR